MTDKPERRPLFLDGRAEAAAANRGWSIQELSEDIDILDVGCSILEHVAASASDHIKAGAEGAARAIDYLAYFMASRGGTVASLILDGYTTDAGALERGMLEAHALQVLIDKEPERADQWFAGKRVKENDILKALEKRTGLGRAWGELGRVVHPNYVVIQSQVTPDGSMGMAGARRPEQLHKLTANFGVLVTRQLQFMARLVPEMLKSVDVKALDDYAASVEAYRARVLARWPTLAELPPSE
jgi:hypothetical protein